MVGAAGELELPEGLETVNRPRPKSWWARWTHSNPEIARDSSSISFAQRTLRRAARRVALVLFLALLSVTAFGDGSVERQSWSGTVSSIQRVTAPPSPGRFLDGRSLHRELGTDVAASAPNGFRSSARLARPAAAGSHHVSMYHVPVLMYHRIAPPSERGHDLPDLVLDPKRFGAQLAALKADGWRTITSGELAAAMEAGFPVPSKTFIITVDDGHDDGYTHAFPILRRYGFVATFFVITSRLDRSGWLTWAELSQMQAAGMEIGNHTLSHVNEAGYSRVETDAQVTGAQAAISTHLGVAPVSFAYPYGRTPANLITSVESSGIKVAYTTARGAIETHRTAYLLPRLRVSATTGGSGILWLVRRYG
jgi:peptidoglycan/xylan/chitin deacetylase (PgdA/CDA1 family)